MFQSRQGCFSPLGALTECALATLCGRVHQLPTSKWLIKPGDPAALMSRFHLLQGIGGQWRHLCALDLSQRGPNVDARKTQMIAAADVSWDVSQNFRWKPLKTTQSCCNNLLLRDANKDFHLFKMGFGCWHADSSQSSWRMPEFRSVGIVEIRDDIRTRSLIAIRLLWCSWCHSMSFQYIHYQKHRICFHPLHPARSSTSPSSCWPVNDSSGR